jgi:hypothetical protein
MSASNTSYPSLARSSEVRGPPALYSVPGGLRRLPRYQVGRMLYGKGHVSAGVIDRATKGGLHGAIWCRLRPNVVGEII